MEFWEHLGQARELRAKANALLDSNGVAPTPVNYELCFHHALGHDFDLKQAVTAAIDAGHIGNAEQARKLHARFFRGASDTEIGQSASHLQVELRKLATVLEAAGEGSSAYGRSLGIAAAQLARADASPQLRSLIDTVASATHLMVENTRELEARVDASAKEVETLRSKLETVRKESLIDALTGLSNRRCFDDVLAAAVAEARADGTPLCVLMCDIDHFKRFDDTWGHATGDQVLRLVAQCVSSNVKGRDTAARYGGEEIAVILPKTTLADAMVVAEQIRRTVESRKIVKKSTGESYGSITLSIGGSEIKAAESGAEFLARADACLYAAKHAGRNRVCGEVPAGAEVTVPAKKCSAQDVAVSAGGSVMEIQFNDHQTEILVDPENTLVDGQLRELRAWYSKISPTGLPCWRDAYLDDLHPLRHVLQLHEARVDASEFYIRFVGAALVHALAADPTGTLLSQSAVYPAALAPPLTRVFEMARLTAQMQLPLRSFSKAVHQLNAREFRGESLFLPFSDDGVLVNFILVATMLTSVVADAKTSTRVA
jgi:diguanylate cyclase